MKRIAVASLVLAALVAGVPSRAGEAGKIYFGFDSSFVKLPVKRANLDGSNVETILPEGCDGITIDPLSNKLYWVNGGEIRRADLDGSNVDQLLSDSDIPGGIALDPANDRMYYAALDNGCVIRTTLLGSNPQFVVCGFPDFPFLAGFVELDLRAGKLYLSDWFGGSGIWRLDLDGSNLENVIPSSPFNGLRMALDLGAEPVPAVSPLGRWIAAVMLAVATAALLYRRRAAHPC